MLKTARDGPSGDCVRPWRDRRLRALLAHIEGLRRCRVMGPPVPDQPSVRVLRPRLFDGWGWPDTIGLVILLTFAALLVRSILR